MSLKYQSLLFFVISFFIFGNLNAQTLIAGWDFQTISTGGTAVLGSPNTPTSFNANFGNGTLYCDGSFGSSVWATTNQLNAFGGTTLNAGAGYSLTTTTPASLALVNSSANGKSIVFKFSMSGYSNLELSYATQRTSQGFTSQEWEYSTDGINWIPLQTITSLPTSFGVQTISNIIALNNVVDAYLRVRLNGATQAAGNNRLDNIQLNAIPSIATPVVSNQTVAATVGSSFSYFISATNSPSSYAATALPSGLVINTITGEISGTPTTASSLLSIPISATNSSGTGNGVLTLSIGQGSQVINFSPIASKVFGDADFLLSATGGNSGNPIIYTSSNTTVASIVSNTVTIQGAGSTVITASQAGNANYFAATNVSQTLDVLQAPQEILFSPLPSKLITDPPFALSAVGGGSGNGIVYSSSNPLVASVSGNIVTIVGAGSTLITASQSGNSNYLPAPDTVQNLVVNLLPQIIMFNA
ncbi:MAG TPA: putative Ig domain-containing protein, partial [Chitinophagaceae bacterium]|nr:putative Ig domain-containing protein [Chitinophagaceae bacterium]